MDHDREEAKANANEARLDLVTVEVLRNALPAIATEMAIDLRRTSYNMMIYEVQDFCCALLDANGRLMAQNMGGVAFFVADLGVVVRDAIERFGRAWFEPGDVVIMNHQRVCGQHLNNMCVYTPIFFAGALQAFAIVRAHWVDIGGMSTGFGTDGMSTDPWMEGLQLDQIKIYEHGVVDQKAMRLIRDNVRMPEASMGDLRGQLAACRLAERRMTEIFDRYGTRVFFAALERIFDDSEAKCRAAVRAIRDGTYEADSSVEIDVPGKAEKIDIRVKVIVEGDDMTIDLTGCSKQGRYANARTLAGALIAYKNVTDPLAPMNEGSFRALKIDIQEGNFMMARYPAVMAGWGHALPTVVDTVLKALAAPLPDRIPAAHHGMRGGSFVFVYANEATKRTRVLATIEGGGWGGREGQDGESASVSNCQGDVKNAPIEAMELKHPVLVARRALRANSGGPGAYRGGLGQVTEVQNLAAGRWSLTAKGRRECPPWGLCGGRAGTISMNEMRQPGENDFKVMDPRRAPTEAGGAIILCTAGGGGWGDPLDRDPAMVCDDVREEFVSIEGARTDYGVIIDRATLRVDQAATSRLRADMRLEAGRGAR